MTPATFLFDHPGMAARWSYEVSCATNPLMTDAGPMLELLKELHAARLTRRHHPLISFSRVLLPGAIATLDHYHSSWAQDKLIVCTAYPDAFWSEQPPTFPSTPLFDWLSAQADSSVVFVTFGSMSFPKSNPWQLDVLIESLIDSKWRFVMLLSSEEATSSEASHLEKVKQRIEQSGNFHTAWIDQPTALRHPAIGIVLHHGGVGGTIESLVAGKPAIIWPFWVDQTTNASGVVDALDAGWQTWQHRDRLVGKVIGSKPGFQVTCTPESLRVELKTILTEAGGSVGAKKRANAVKAGELLRKEWREQGGEYLDEFIALL